LDKLQALSASLGSTVVLKGAFTAIADPSGCIYFNSTGNPAMATGGTGDALTGILTSLMAQSYSGTQAAILGVYLHGLAGDYVAIDKGDRGLIASDLIEMIPEVCKKLIRA
jgi:ADP-dependent NAD(P)H-hydrate dehydratase / NAD(P)H-hydrate epimerase